MTKTPVLRLLAVSFLMLALSACGFHLRNKIALPEDLGPVLVTSTTEYSPLADAVATGLALSGAIAADADAKEVAKLEILSERWGDLPIAIDAQGRAQEFSLRYAAEFALRDANGKDVVPQQVIELSRDYVAPAADAIGKASERELLSKELRRDMTAAILRRIDAASRQR